MAGRPKSREGKYERITLEVASDVLAFIDRQPDSRRGYIETLVRRAMEDERKKPMKYNAEQDAYFGVVSDGRTIRVESVEYQESERDGAGEDILNDPDMWAGLVGDNQNVEYVG
jgi:hypothetical protein